MTTPSVQPAVQPAVSSAWLTQAQENAVAGQVASPVYPGPITTDHAGGPETVPGRDPSGGQATNPVPLDLDGGVPTGGGQFPELPDSGHAGPVAPFDASARPFAGSGPVPDTHSYDSGGAERKSQVLQPQAKGWFRRVLDGMTYDKQAQVTDTRGWQQNVPTGRADLDQYQGQDADAYDPFQVPYSERAVYANFAFEMPALTGTPDAYTPSGQLPDMTPAGGQGNELYTEPDDPPVNTTAASPSGPYPYGEDVGYF